MVKLGTYPMQSLRERAEAIIRAAGNQPPEGRSAFIEKECHGDQELQAAVQQLLNSRGPKTDRFAAAANHHTAHEPNTLGFSNSGATSLSRGDEVGPYHIVEPLGADRKSTRLNSSHIPLSRMPSSA